MPDRSGRLGSDPFSSRMRVQSELPTRAAKWRAVLPVEERG